MRSHLQQLLIERNVAFEISQKVCDSVLKELEGSEVQSNFTRTQTIFTKALESSLLKIIVPSQKQIDMLDGIQQARKQNRVYSIVFVGVNGVGKSTSLSKIAAYLNKKRNLKVSMAACDTFRSGAVEQLQTHSRALNVRLYQQGYSRDAAIVCRDAIRQANKLNDDVILIDTAGRMQDNEPLMRSLAKLVGLNKPDLILFVGEALVGNEAVDQLTKFNRALSDFSQEQNPRLIDAIVLTKFDTVDEKVGAAISMTYSTGSPIAFVGTGQTYDDLKRVQPKNLVQMLLK